MATTVRQARRAVGRGRGRTTTLRPEEVRERIGDIPWMSLPQAQRLTTFIHRNGIHDILELGFYSGVSTCYFAAAVDASGAGSVTAIDKEKVRGNDPNIGELLARTGLGHRVRVFYEPDSYTWRLMRFLEEQPAPVFDFCYVDGAHRWSVDGFAFFLVDRLLRPGGWIVFDDLDWKVAGCPVNRDAEWALRWPEEERNTAQVRRVYELLVRPHPSYGEFRIEDGMAFARKVAATPEGRTTVRTEVIVKPVPVPEGRFAAFLRHARIDGKTPREELPAGHDAQEQADS